MSKNNRNEVNPWATTSPSATTGTIRKPKPTRSTSGAPPPPTAAPKRTSTTSSMSSKIDVSAAPGKPSPSASFETAKQQHLEAAKRVTITGGGGYESSSDEEDLAADELLATVLKGYGDGDRSALSRTQECLESTFQSGAATCLICIASVRRVDHV